MPKTDKVAPVPLSIRVTPIQGAVLASERYAGKSGAIIRFFLSKFINDELPDSLKKELEQHLEMIKIA